MTGGSLPQAQVTTTALAEQESAEIHCYFVCAVILLSRRKIKTERAFSSVLLLGVFL